MSQGFYKFLEDKYRGSRDLIIERVSFYKQFIVPVKNILSTTKAIDLGCGRGEWLEVLGASGYSAIGVDTDNDMLADCIERGLNAKNQDALECLKSQSDESVAIISGFHIAEHLPFEYLIKLIEEAARTLVPGGLLILETPNAENLTVGTNTFYIDPTHIKPISYQLLSIIPEFVGFYRTKIIRLQEDPFILEKGDLSLYDVFSGVSSDYAVIAQKNGNNIQINSLNDVFNKEYGVSLDRLSCYYEKIRTQRTKDIVSEENTKMANSITNLSELIQDNLGKINEFAVIAIQNANEKFKLAEDKIASLEKEIETEQAQVAYWHAQSDHWYKQVLAIHSSTSWIITKPIRLIKRVNNKIYEKLKNILIKLLKLTILNSVCIIKKYPSIWRRIRFYIIKYPKLHALALRLKSGKVTTVKSQEYNSEQIKVSLSPREREILGMLQNQLDKYKGKVE